MTIYVYNTLISGGGQVSFLLKNKINVYQNKVLAYELVAEQGEKLSHVLFSHGIFGVKSLCDGLGKCGKCRVIIKDFEKITSKEKEILSASDIEKNVRLSCQHFVESNLDIYISKDDSEDEILYFDREFNQLFLAVDLGTSSIYWQVLTDKNEVLAKGHGLNAQAGVGGDVISRLAYANNFKGRRELSLVIVRYLKKIISNIKNKYNSDIELISLCANTAMTSIFLELDVQSLCAAPYKVPTKGNIIAEIEGLPSVYIPPQFAPFVGGDISAGLVYLQSTKPKYPYLFVDMGTNGECVLALSESEIYITSVPLGPAMEGIGLSCGSIAMNGSINNFSLSPFGLSFTTINGAKAKNICATGAISLLCVLLNAGIIDENASLNKNINSPLANKILKNIEQTENGFCLNITDEIYFNALDIEAILNIRASLKTALNMLLEHANISKQQLANLIITGNFAEHVNVQNLEQLGFIPSNMQVQVLSNTSLQGASLLINKDLQNLAGDLYNNKQVIDIANDKKFMDKFINNMQFTIF